MDESADVATWMIVKGYATGHGDTVADMLDELERQAIDAERKRCVDIVRLARAGEIDGDFRSIINRMKDI